MATTVAYNSSEGLADTVTVSIANSGGASGTAWDNVNLGSGGSVTGDNDHVMHGVMATKYTQATSQVHTSWYATGIPSAISDCAVQVYVWVPANPTASTTLFRGYNDTAQTVPSWVITWSNTGKLIVQGTSTGTTLYTSTASMTPATWLRFEVEAVAGASVRCAVYVGDSTTALVDSGVIASTGITATASYRQGICTTSSGFGSVWFDDTRLGSGPGFFGVATSARPTTVVSNAGGLTSVGGAASIAAAVGDNSDTTYAQTASGPIGASFTVGGYGLMAAGSINATHRESQDVASPIVDCLFEVMSGSTVIGSHTVALSTTPTDYVLSVPSPTVPDWSDLRTRTTYTTR